MADDNHINSEDEESLDFEVDNESGDLPWTDGGTSEEFQEAEQQTKSAVLRLAEGAAQGQRAIEQARMEPDLVKRGRALAALGAVEFPDEKMVRSGDQFIMQPQSTDDNRWAVFEALFGDGLERPHLNTFSGRLVDWRGDTVDERYPMVELVRAMGAAGLKGQSAMQARGAFKEWAAMASYNDLVVNFEERLVKWDGVKRMEMSLIELFKCHNTELTRRFSVYFWLSLYNRIMTPGCFAPMVLSLFGAQDAGKSYFSKLICEEVLGDPTANAVQLDLGSNKNEFLREMTGASVVANIGEMTGFNRGDLNKIKSFITTTSDSMHYKYEGTFSQQRQWIAVMDGNKYEGLQRDETGNRRFYPIFLGQLVHKQGKPDWRATFSIDYSNFRRDFWQMMGECKAWMAHHGKNGYNNYVKEVSKAVAVFNAEETKRDSGTIADDKLDLYLPEVLDRVPRRLIKGHKNRGMFIATFAIVEGFARFDKHHHAIFSRLKSKMTAMGAIPCNPDGNGKTGYLFNGFESIEDFESTLKSCGWKNLYAQDALNDGDMPEEVYETLGVVDVAGDNDKHGGF